MLTVQEKAGEEKTPCCVCVQVLTEKEFSPHPFDYICIKLVKCVVGSELYISSPAYPIFLLCTSDCSLLTHCFSFHICLHYALRSASIAQFLQHVEARRLNADANTSCSLSYGNAWMDERSNADATFQCRRCSWDATHTRVHTHSSIHTSKYP